MKKLYLIIILFVNMLCTGIFANSVNKFQIKDSATLLLKIDNSKYQLRDNNFQKILIEYMNQQLLESKQRTQLLNQISIPSKETIIDNICLYYDTDVSEIIKTNNKHIKHNYITTWIVLLYLIILINIIYIKFKNNLWSKLTCILILILNIIFIILIGLTGVYILDYNYNHFYLQISNLSNLLK